MKAQKFIQLLVVAAGLLAYHNSFTGPFLFDDVSSIQENPTICHLWPIWDALVPPHEGGITVEGRPLINLSLAINYALGGTNVWGYHALNLAVHILAGLTLLGIVRRTLRQPRLRERFAAVANELALAVAVIWTVHPLQTESVTYIVQRAESIVGLFYLLMLYCFIRAAESPRPRVWYGLCVSACALGMASKEVMMSAPLMVLLYDRTFVAGSFAQAWRKRWRWHAGLACTWIVAGWLALGVGDRGGTAGFGTGGILWWQYALTQCWALGRYLWLCVWPRGLVFDYGTGLITAPAEVIPYALILAALLAGTVLGLVYRPQLGFLGAWFFMILAPSSSAVPVASQTIAEHRMYLPLAAVIVLGVMGIHALVGRRTVAVVAVLAVGLGFLTVQRNEDYRSELAIWADTVAKRPENPRAHNNLGKALGQAGRIPEAIEHLERALRIKPDDNAEAHNNLGNALRQAGKIEEAIGHYEQALWIGPDFAEAHYNLGIALAQVGKIEEAITHYEQALRIEPDFAEAHYNLGLALSRIGKIQDAIGHYEQTLRLKPDYAEAHYNLGAALVRLGRLPEAMGHWEQALRIKPDYAEAGNNLAWLLATLAPGDGGDPVRAVTLAERACELTKNRVAEYLDTLAVAYAAAGRFNDAIAAAQKAVGLARSAGQTQVVSEIETRLELYRAGRAYRAPASVTSPHGP